MCMRESLASSCGFMPNHQVDASQVHLYLRNWELGHLECHLKTAKLFKEHSDRGWSPAIVMKIYLHALTCSSLV